MSITGWISTRRGKNVLSPEDCDDLRIVGIYLKLLDRSGVEQIEYFSWFILNYRKSPLSNQCIIYLKVISSRHLISPATHLFIQRAVHVSVDVHFIGPWTGPPCRTHPRLQYSEWTGWTLPYWRYSWRDRVRRIFLPGWVHLSVRCSSGNASNW